MGFNEAQISKNMICVETMSYFILVNGAPHEKLNPLRGLRQGDPLSPYIFLICVEGFLALLNREEYKLIFQGLRINKHCPSTSHIFFVDDSLIVCRASRKDCDVIKNVIKTYEIAPGQTVNLDKSVSMVSKNVNEATTRDLCSILGVEKKTPQVRNYLGMPSQNE